MRSAKFGLTMPGAMRAFTLLLALVSMSAGQGCEKPLYEGRECGDHEGEAYAANAYDPAVYHPCRRECRAGNDTRVDCRCSRSCPCWDYH